MCNQGVETPTNAYQGTAFDSALQIALNGNMCTAVCPCPGSAKATYDGVAESTMNYWNRTRAVGVGNNTQQQIRMSYSTAALSFLTFSDCFEKVLAPAISEDDAKAMRGVIKVMEAMEARFSCSGFCQPGLFWFTKDVGTAPPTDNCLTYMMNEIGTKYTPVGATAIASGIIMSLIWLFQYALWCKYDE